MGAGQSRKTNYRIEDFQGGKLEIEFKLIANESCLHNETPIRILDTEAGVSFSGQQCSDSKQSHIHMRVMVLTPLKKLADPPEPHPVHFFFRLVLISIHFCYNKTIIHKYST